MSNTISLFLETKRTPFQIHFEIVDNSSASSAPNKQILQKNNFMFLHQRLVAKIAQVPTKMSELEQLMQHRYGKVAIKEWEDSQKVFMITSSNDKF